MHPALRNKNGVVLIRNGAERLNSLPSQEREKVSTFDITLGLD
jgi:hypothetical protein